MRSTSRRAPSSAATRSSARCHAGTGRSPTKCGARYSGRIFSSPKRARDGNDRRARFRCARGECNEAAAAIEAALALGLIAEPEANAVLADLDRLAAMLTGLLGFTSS